jgi:hypothetical protein
MRLTCRTTARASLLAVVLLAGGGGCASSVPLPSLAAITSELAPPGDSIGPDVAYLASRALKGRLAGSAGGDSASAYVARRYERLGLAGPFPSPCTGSVGCRAARFQRFKVLGGTAHNVAALVPGSDPSLGEEYVVVGAHSDHIGTSIAMANDVDRGEAVRPGADDNASGTAAVLELARRLAERPPRRSVLLVNFDAEEIGLVGSSEFLAHPPIDPQRMVLMVNLDMVGRLRDERLYVEVHGPRSLAAFVDSSARASDLRSSPTRETSGRSDHATFVAWHIPAVALFTGFHDDYHRATDLAARVNVAGIRRVVDVAERIVRGAADRETAVGGR